jgi:Ca2+-binding EF-hand superfamily protein
MSLLFAMQAQESGGGQPPPPPADNENGTKPDVSEFFSSIDSDGDGNVSQTELGSFLQAQGGSEDDAAKIFSALDSDGNGSVSEDELAQSVERGRPQRAEHRPPPSAADLAEKLFSEADTDSNGSLTKTELEEYVKSSGGTAEQADELFATLDTEGTGSVTKDQLIAAAEELEANRPSRPDPATWSRYSDNLATATKPSSSVAVAA